MMNASLKIARIWNIPIGLHWSWFIVFALVTFSLGAGVFPADFPGLSPAAYVVLAFVTSLLLFSSVLLHELGHTAVALRYGVPVREINLFIFGGVAMMTRESPSAKAELWIAAAGPIVSFALAGIFGALYLIGGDLVYLTAPAMWLAWVNLMLAVFNLIPGFPLDGGRILRAAVWHYHGDMHKATRFAATGGQWTAVLFIAYGVYLLLTVSLFSGLWIAFIGWFLHSAATMTLMQSRVESSLTGVTVKDVLPPAMPSIPAWVSLRQFVDNYVLRFGGRSFAVVDSHGEMLGVLTVDDLSKVPQENWERISAGQIAQNFEQIMAVTPDAAIVPVLQKMEEVRAAQAAVVESGNLHGIITREHLLRYIQLRDELRLDEKAKPINAAPISGVQYRDSTA